MRILQNELELARRHNTLSYSTVEAVFDMRASDAVNVSESSACKSKDTNSITPFPITLLPSRAEELRCLTSCAPLFPLHEPQQGGELGAEAGLGVALYELCLLGDLDCWSMRNVVALGLVDGDGNAVWPTHRLHLLTRRAQNALIAARRLREPLTLLLPVDARHATPWHDPDRDSDVLRIM